MEHIAAVLVDGIIYAAWLFVAAVGMTLIYGVMKIVNITHGSFYALGAYAGASMAGAWPAWLMSEPSSPASTPSP